MQKRYTIPLVAAGVGVLVVPTLATAHNVSGHPQLTKQRVSMIAPHDVTAFKTFQTTAGRGTRITISRGGNIIEYKSPNTGGAQYEHIGVGAFSEGYVICYNPTVGNASKAFDTGDSQNGFNAPIPSGSTVTRTTTDGKVRLKQTFTFTTSATTGTTFNVQMAVTNLTGAPLTGFILRRQVDFDIDTGGAQGWAGFFSTHARTKASVEAFHDPSEAPAGKEAHGILMRSSQNSTGVTALTQVTQDILDNTCTPAPAPLDPSTKVARGDFGDSIAYTIGTLGAHATKTVAVQYLRY